MATTGNPLVDGLLSGGFRVLSAAGPSLGPSARSSTENAMNPYYLWLGILNSV
jgi:hypothetical protein